MCSVHQSAGSSSHVFKGPVLTQEVCSELHVRDQLAAQSADHWCHNWSSPTIFLLLQVNNTTYTYGPTQKVLEPNFVVGTPSAARLPEAGSQLNCVALPGDFTMEKYSRPDICFVSYIHSLLVPPLPVLLSLLLGGNVLSCIYLPWLS
jgi:hypothetical protein